MTKLYYVQMGSGYVEMLNNFSGRILSANIYYRNFLELKNQHWPIYKKLNCSSDNKKTLELENEGQPSVGVVLIRQDWKLLFFQRNRKKNSQQNPSEKIMRTNLTPLDHRSACHILAIKELPNKEKKNNLFFHQK